ncbi:MAG: hypothetical protein LBJ32_04390 [Oscillospiraceae bacterium]|jgi:hypothetical protein|nr:hypothetical protein [Oscillospiraceae bacterium]
MSAMRKTNQSFLKILAANLAIVSIMPIFQLSLFSLSASQARAMEPKNSLSSEENKFMNFWEDLISGKKNLELPSIILLKAIFKKINFGILLFLIELLSSTIEFKKKIDSNPEHKLKKPLSKDEEKKFLFFIRYIFFNPDSKISNAGNFIYFDYSTKFSGKNRFEISNFFLEKSFCKIEICILIALKVMLSNVLKSKNVKIHLKSC